MNTNFDPLNLPAGGRQGFGPMQRPTLFPNAGIVAPIPPVLTPQQQSILQLLARHIASNSSPYAPGSGTSTGAGAQPAGQPPAQVPTPPATVPRYEVVKHPNAPARLPYVIQDNATGGYVTGGSPLFPRLFSTSSDANEAKPSDETVLASSMPARPAMAQGQAGRSVSSAPSFRPEYETKLNPDAPARLSYGHWDNQAQDWVRDRFGFAQAFGTQAEADANMPTATIANSESSATTPGANQIPTAPYTP